MEAERTFSHNQGEALTDRAPAGPGSPEPTHGAGEDFSRTMTFARASGPNSTIEDSYLTKAATEPPPPLSALLSAPDPSAVPSKLGRYKLRRELGQGGFGKVYVGYDDQLDREVAIKVPIRRLEDSEVGTFLQEAKRLARLRHPGIVTVYDVGVQDGRCFIVSEIVAGTSLRDWLRDRKPTPEESARIVASIADALDHAHGLGTIHRDVKPANVILDETLRPVLLDFGLALNESELSGPTPVIVGTPAYMSPEQARAEGHRIDGRTDIYSLGVVLYLMLCGRRPFRSDQIHELLRQVREDEPQPPRQVLRTIPRELERICLKAMAKRIADRYTTAGDLAEELRDHLKGGGASASSTFRVPAAEPDEPPPAGSRRSAPKPTPAGRPWACPVCGKMVAAGASECPNCEGSGSSSGSRSSARMAGDAPSIERKLHETERRQVTVLNCGCELEDAETSLSALDPEHEHELLVEFRQCCREVVVRQGGTVAVSTAQGLQACFGFPVAHEDAPRRAIEAALAIVGQLELVNERLRRTSGVALAPWATIHSGPAIVGELETGEGLSIVGEAPNVAARLDGVVEPGWVVITEATRKLVQGFFACDPLGARAIRGIPRPVELHRVVGRGEAANRFDAARSAGLSPLTGRDLEVNLLKSRWEYAKEQSTQLVHLTGEAGIGKSRLVLVLKEFVADDEPGRAAAILEWRCSPQSQDSGLYPAIDCLERILRLRPSDSPKARFEKLSGHLKVLDLDDPSRLALMASMLSIPTEGLYELPPLSPQRQREKTLESLLDWLEAQASRRAVLFIVEDLHWVDPSTLEFLGMLLEQRPAERIMTVLTSRPEFVPPWPTGSGQVTLAINRLTRKELAELVRKKVGLQDLSNEVVEQLASRTDGVPLFIEEFARMLEEEGHLREVDGVRALSGSFPAEAIPATLHDLLLSRLDRMPGVKDVAQLGASIGREFSLETIRAVSTMPEAELRSGLGRLVQAEILFEKGRAPRTSYQFKHALIQDAAYQSMLKGKRQQVHERIARVVESTFPEVARSQPELLAHHYSAAGDAGPAIEYWREAVRRSQARSAHAEAIGHVARGLEQIRTLPESPARDEIELGFQVPLSVSLLAARGYAVPDLEGVHARARELAERIGAQGPLFHVIWGTWAFRLLRDEMDTAIDLAGRLLELGQALGDQGLTMEAWFSLAITRFYRGDFRGCLDACRHCEELEDREANKANARDMGQDTGMSYRCYRALALWHLGEPDDAWRRINEAVEYSRDAGHPFSLAYALHHGGWMSYVLRRGDDGIRFGDECVELSHDQGYPFWKALGIMSRGTGHMVAGRLDEALRSVEEAMASYIRTGSRKSLAEYHGFLAEIHGKAGRLDEALAEVDEALAIADRTNSRCYEPELHRIKGEILLARSPDDEGAAEACFEKSIELARGQDARSWELRGAMSLGKLRRKQGRPGEAEPILAGIYQRFTQGFETPDLRDARALLDRWSGG